MSDRYGIPENMFGPVPDEFYALVGRVAMVATMLEDRLLGLLWAIDDSPQERYAGLPFGRLAELCQKQANILEPPLAQTASELIAEVKQVMQRRNEIVHSLWTRPELDTALGWRNVLPKHRVNDWYPAVWIETDEDRIANTIRTMVELVARCDAVATEAQSRKSRGV